MDALLGLMVLALPALTRGLVEVAQRRARERTWRAFEPSGSLDARRGYKVAQVIASGDGSAWLAGVTSLRYRVDALARCRRRSCRPPGLDCRCGFYAFRDRSRALNLLRKIVERHPARAYVLLTVDLDGSVLEYEEGYRAQRQRVLQVEIPQACHACRRSGMLRPAELLGTDLGFRSEQLLYEPTLAARSSLPPGSSPVRALCRNHRPVGSSSRLLDLGHLTGMLGTEIRWLHH